MNKTIIPTKEFSLSKRNIIDNLLVEEYERFDVEHYILTTEKLSDMSYANRQFHKKQKLLYGNRVYVILHIINTDMPFFRGIDRGFDTYDIFVPENKYIEIIGEYIEHKRRIMEDIQCRIRRIKKTDHCETIEQININRKVVKKIKNQINILEELKVKLMKYLN